MSASQVRQGVRKAIEVGIEERRDILESLTRLQKKVLLEKLFEDFFLEQHGVLKKWSTLTGQSAQVDTGYIAQFVASIVTGIPGQGFRGKGDDLVDGSEVKSAANISGIDRPRWNHNLGTISADKKRGASGEKTTGEQYLSMPMIFYLLVDRATTTEENGSVAIRIRTWCINVQEDAGWRDLVKRFLQNRSSSQYNLQLHPPVGHDSNLVVNTLGNLDMSDVLVFDYRLSQDEQGSLAGRWHKELGDFVIPVTGRTSPEPYRGRSAQRSVYTSAKDLVGDVSFLSEWFPDVFMDT